VAGGEVLVVIGECLDDVAASLLALGAGAALPVDQEALTAYVAAYIVTCVGPFAKNLHGVASRRFVSAALPPMN
jgi:hypothetical protein